MEQSLLNLRASLPVVDHCCYFQTGSLGPPSRATLDAIAAAQELAAREGPAAPAALQPLLAMSDAARAALGALLGASPNEVSWTHNTSHAMRAGDNDSLTSLPTAHDSSPFQRAWNATQTCKRMQLHRL